jgi:AcrR family transcriptional regulator
MDILSSGSSRSSYHHGDLAAALVAAGLRRARERGPEGIVLRELAASAGVVPSAAYRHFPDRAHLVAAIAQAARERLANAMAEAAATVEGDGGTAAARRFGAIGGAYVRWAIGEPRLYATAFTPVDAMPPRPDEPNAWTILNVALDELVATGAMPTELRAEAPMIAWTMVHGLAGLLTGAAMPVAGDPDDAIVGMQAAVLRALEIHAAE